MRDDARHIAGKRSSAGQFGGTVPRQEVVDAIHGMIGDMRQHMAQLGFGIDTVQLGCADQRVHGGVPFDGCPCGRACRRTTPSRADVAGGAVVAHIDSFTSVLP